MKNNFYLLLMFVLIAYGGCASDNDVSLAHEIVKSNSLKIDSKILAKRIQSSDEQNISAKATDALSSFGVFAPFNSDKTKISETNCSNFNDTTVSFALRKLYERGYKLEAKKIGMELLPCKGIGMQVLMTMGGFYEIEGDYRGATIFYLDALNFGQKSERINYALAKIYYLQKKSKLALRYAKIALQQDSIENQNIKNLIQKIEKMVDSSQEPDDSF